MLGRRIVIFMFRLISEMNMIFAYHLLDARHKYGQVGNKLLSSNNSSIHTLLSYFPSSIFCEDFISIFIASLYTMTNTFQLDLNTSMAPLSFFMDFKVSFFGLLLFSFSCFLFFSCRILTIGYCTNFRLFSVVLPVTILFINQINHSISVYRSLCASISIINYSTSSTDENQLFSGKCLHY